MIKNANRTILVVNDVAATLVGIEVLLKHDGYRIVAARDEPEAIDKARFNLPDLMLISVDGEIKEVIAAAVRIRRRAALNLNLPIIIFCVGELKEGAEAAVGQNIYLAHPNNFNQMRRFISRLLLKFSKAALN